MRAAIFSIVLLASILMLGTLSVAMVSAWGVSSYGMYGGYYPYSGLYYNNFYRPYAWGSFYRPYYYSNFYRPWGWNMYGW
ncbi:Uncharacterised protein [uncultured archaeon]|nr:Uncharacterised protein [uncultured archaeon]